MTSKCQSCDKTVYPMEAVKDGAITWHKGRCCVRAWRGVHLLCSRPLLPLVCALAVHSMLRSHARTHGADALAPGCLCVPRRKKAPSTAAGCGLASALGAQRTRVCQCRGQRVLFCSLNACLALTRPARSLLQVCQVLGLVGAWAWADPVVANGAANRR